MKDAVVSESLWQKRDSFDRRGGGILPEGRHWVMEKGEHIHFEMEKSADGVAFVWQKYPSAL